MNLPFDTARFLAGGVPCQQHPDMAGRRYQVNNKSPFRVRCGATGCNHELRQAGLTQWIVAMVTEGRINWIDLLDKWRKVWR
jgi:hypothetical protein